MEWQRGRRSSNIEDRRGMGGMGGGGMRMGRVAGGGGIGIIVVALIAMFLGVDPSIILQGGGGLMPMDQPGSSSQLEPAKESELKEFVSVVLADTEDTWNPIFQQLGRQYEEPPLVLFSGAVQSACGMAGAATGPFYCPGDKKVYLDTSFFTTLRDRLGAGGDFAAAYVVAHEIGHHVQDELGILGQANEIRQQVSEAESNAISVRIELQADCLSGIWAHEAAQTLGVVEKGDFEEALNAAHQIGDDTLQRNAGQRPMPHTFTHGTSEQRAKWFMIGLRSGQLADCDTFAAEDL